MKFLVTPTSFCKPENRAARERLEAYAGRVVYNDLGIPLKGEALLARLAGADAYIAGLDYIDGAAVERMPPSLKVISRYGAGVDRIDLAACRKRGIVVTNTPGANATAVCELTFGLLLSVARHIPRLNEQVRQGGWPRENGLELCGRTLGILGLGAIGKLVAARAKAFGMEVVAYDPYLDRAFAEKEGVAPVTLEALLQRADVVSLHLPLNVQTRNILNAQRIAALKPGAILINASRGGLLDEAAAAQALAQGRLWGIGLDAFAQEPPADSPLKGLPNVVFTPHTGAHTAEAVARMGLQAVENAIQVLEGRSCPYIVTDA